jgi:hypothetical protein
VADLASGSRIDAVAGYLVTLSESPPRYDNKRVYARADGTVEHDQARAGADLVALPSSALASIPSNPPADAVGAVRGNRSRGEDSRLPEPGAEALRELHEAPR